jgi:hypothetical protein
MSYKNIVISSGHGLYVRGASGILDEVDEARKVVESVATNLRERGAQVKTFHDDVSTTQNENLDRIVDYHNAQSRQLDISVHFNAYVACSGPMGCEVLYKSQSTLSTEMSKAMSEAGGFINRGAKKRTDLFFLNQTQMPALLLECCFVDSTADAELYRANYEAVCEAVAAVLKHQEGEAPPKPSSVLVDLSGKCSYFGGPEDEGVSPDEGLAFIQDMMEAPHLFLPYQPEGTTGLARRLNTEVSYVACRWNYDITPPDMLLKKKALIRVPGGAELTAFPADWGPHSSTGRVADLSPRLFDVLKLKTDDEVEVIFPA